MHEKILHVHGDVYREKFSRIAEVLHGAILSVLCKFVLQFLPNAFQPFLIKYKSVFNSIIC